MMATIRCLFTAGLFCILVISAQGQEFDENLFWERDSTIEAFLRAGDYAKVEKHIDAQIEYLQWVGRPDSVYLYAYNAARARWKTKGSEAGVDRAETLVEWIVENDPDIDHHLQAINDLTWIYEETGHPEKCLESDERYLAVCLAYPGVKPIQLSTAYYSLGYDHQKNGDGKKAAQYFSKSIEPLLIDTFAYHQRLIDSYNGLGTALFRIGKHAQAKKALNTSLKYIELLSDSFDICMSKANALGNLSLIAQDEGNLVECKSFLYQSLSVRKLAIHFASEAYHKEQQQRFLISNYHNLAALYLEMGDLSRAEKLSVHVRDLRKKYLEADHPDHNKSLEAFGSIRYAMSDYDEALKYFKDNLHYCEAEFGERSYYSAVANQRLGKVLFEKGDYQGSINYFTKAIDIGQLISTDYSGQEMFSAYLIRSEVYGAMENYILAENDVRSALRIYQMTRTENDPLFGKAYTTLSELKIKQGQIDSAEYYADKALSVLLDKQKEQTEKFGRGLASLVYFLPYTYYTKAMVVKMREPGEKSLRESMNYLQLSVDYLKETKNYMDDNVSQLTYYEEHEKTFNATQDVCYELYASSGDTSLINRMLSFTEENKSILLRRQLQHFTSLRVSNVPDSIISKERVLVTELSAFQPQVEGSRDFQDFQKEYEDLLGYIKENYPAYFNLRYQEQTATISDIRKLLVGENKNVIQYILTADKAYGLFLNKTHTELIKLDIREVRDQLKEYNRQIIARNRTAYTDISQKLYRSLFKPFEPYLTGNEILIVPDNALINVNFETFMRPDHTGKLHYLINDYAISYLLSSTTAVQYTGLKDEKTEGALAFAPGFSDDLKSMYRSEMQDSSRLDETYLYRIQQPFAVRTAEEVAGIFRGQAFTKEAATERNFKEEAGKYRIIHLGTHTEINNLSPLLSRLVLTKPATADQEDDDGYLHAYEIYNLSLRAELAVLTACETGIGKNSATEGVFSLAHGFAYAGCPSVVMSLWQIDEKTAARIIESFYENLAEGMAKNEALRAAKLDYLKENPGELSDPYYWSGLILLGDTMPLEKTSEIHPLLIALLIIAGISLFVLFFGWRKNTHVQDYFKKMKKKRE